VCTASTTRSAASLCSRFTSSTFTCVTQGQRQGVRCWNAAHHCKGLVLCAASTLIIYCRLGCCTGAQPTNCTGHGLCCAACCQGCRNHSSPHVC
jgi:hypothetical protein